MGPQKPQSRVNSMLSVWYGVIIGVLQAYLIVQSVRKFVWFAELSWPYQRTPFVELNVYIALTGISVLMLPFFLAASFLQIGNTANDNRMLGRDLNRRDEWSSFLIPSMLYQGTKGFFRTVWTNSGPTSSFIHVVSSFCLLLPQTIMEAVLLKFGYLGKDSMWRTDLEFLIPQGERDAILKILNSVGTEGLEADGSSKGTSLMDYSSGSMRLEYFNYGLAILIFSIRYASVFWYTNRPFATLFTLQALINCVHSLISFSAISVLYKLDIIGSLKILHRAIPFLLNGQVVILLYIISVTILLLSTSVLYHYGYLKILFFVHKKARTQYITGGGNHRLSWTYFPHCSALAVFLALAASQSPLIHDVTYLYNSTLDNCLLLYIVSGGVQLLLWIVLWLVLATKRDWDFNITVNVGNIRVGDFDALRLAAEICLSDPNDTNLPLSPMSSSMLVVSGGQAFAVGDVNCQRNILDLVNGVPPITREGESDERIYWPRAFPATQTVNSLEDEDQPWLKDSKEVRNKVTFYDDVGSPRKYASVPLTRGGALKRSFREKAYTVINQVEDEGDYAVLKRGKGCLKPQPPREIEAEEVNQNRVAHATIPGGQYSLHVNPMSVLRREANLPQTTPRSVLSTDSGYPGTESVCRSESRSASSTGSPPDRTAPSDSSSSGVHSTSTFNGTAPQSRDCCPQQCCTDPYGRLGLMRKESIRSTVNPIYEGGSSQGKIPSSIYQSRPKSSIESENPYGETQRRASNQCTESSIPLSLDSPPYQPSSSYNHCNIGLAPSKYNNISTANEMVERANNNIDQMLPQQKIYGQIVRKASFEPIDTTSPIQSTPYGRCTNMSSFATQYSPHPSMEQQIPPPLPSASDNCIPPVPPPLPPLSFCVAGVSNSRVRSTDGILESQPQHSNPTRHTTFPNFSNANPRAYK